MLTQHTIDIIKATVPAVSVHANDITAHFYPLMFREYPEVKRFFNQKNQAGNAQPKALANALVAYAANIDNLSVLEKAVSVIVNKHVVLDIQPAHYEIVGECLLKAIKAVLGDAATDEVIDAWGLAYWQLADLLIGAEEAVYSANEEEKGMWRGEREFRVTTKAAESDNIMSFYLTPTDGEPAPSFTPGQFLGLVLNIDGEETRRQYSLSDSPNSEYLRISVKREEGGAVSNYLHDRIQAGDTLHVLAPAGDFILKDNNKPVVLVTGGVGITPAISMLNSLKGTDRPIHFIHAAMNTKVHAFRDHVTNLAAENENIKPYFVYSDATSECKPDATGFINLAMLEDKIGDDRDVEFYFLGPKPFMQAMNGFAPKLGIPAENVHFEFFGPSEDLNINPTA
ncbi:MULTISPECIES: NO-inducible flavohemoprotein [unclassified Moritella]|uniref:NO-inducible flavohemoprotein n=1 Tax=unclassified Moritella TaxID=2637987 RepID=UPI001BA965F1|nr:MULTISPECIES: NO-inducible flavohemoprotein [unclassified Moritella]QUM84922.1 NO-inducible flavohemoprotein [Moritella sp. 28]QUM89154.1 NO-inducible flavohemoprotein [Moritella sp. 36]